MDTTTIANDDNESMEKLEAASQTTAKNGV